MRDELETRAVIGKLAYKYAPDDMAESWKEAIDRDCLSLCMLEMAPEQLSGKEAIELVREKGKNDRNRRYVPTGRLIVQQAHAAQHGPANF